MDIQSEKNSKPDESRTGRNLEDELRQRGDSFMRSGIQSIANECDRLSSAVHSAAERLHEKQDPFGGYVDKFAGGFDRITEKLHTQDPQDAYNSLRDFSLRRPGLTAGGMFLAGFAVSRFLKAGKSPE